MGIAWWLAVVLAVAGMVLAQWLAAAFAWLALPLVGAVGYQLLTNRDQQARGTTVVPSPSGGAAPAPPSSDEYRVRGIALQGQGKLDAAFEQFRQCAPDAGTFDLLYNLALEFERERRFDGAATVLHHLDRLRPGYRDVAQRIRRAELMLETGAAVVAPPSDAPPVDSRTGKQVLGRYVVEKELGKGAMGVVYLGRDPTIGRVVAIKTMSLSAEFDAEEIADVKARFFREAETAGKLAHPHIVTIYDAGEAGDLAWIAIELLRGHDLTRHVNPGTLLPVTTVVELVAQAADALDYAHQQGVIHRDIKPANLVYERTRRTLKVTDFGIARITDSSRTRTGLVLGTPSYMSPEQLRGKPLDGRSDLFSLGVTLYQLLTGQLPFRADSMAALVERISSDTPMPPSDLRPELPAELDPIVERALHKDAGKRFQRADDLARALRALHSEEGELWV
jgi:eukaryotic-like serine/threonine-protein kinase